MQTEFEMTRSRIADAFHVDDIATYPLIACNKTDNPSSVLAKYKEYDQFLFKRMVGLLVYWNVFMIL